jgi:photosystem II stability/assembly factor-like uncharacterized protein
MKKNPQALLVGSSKGLHVYDWHEGQWKMRTTYFEGAPVNYIFIDKRNGTWWVTLNHSHWGIKLHRSTDRGQTWEEIPPPQYPSDALLRNGQKASLRKIWSMAAGGPHEPEVLYLGTEPGGLFKSSDGGQTFQLMEDLWNHPSRMDYWFGAGRDYPFIHSIIIDPSDSQHIYIAVSCAGVFESKDGGITWEIRNQGLKAAYLPNPTAELGHDPHLLLQSPVDHQVLWQQNHCGIYISEDGGLQWKEVSGQEGFPHYGFALAIDESNPRKAWVIPAVSDEKRIAVDQALCVCHTDNGGKTWSALREGLPQAHCFDIVFRHALAKKGPIMAFGTTTGNVFWSADEGAQWNCLTNYLPRIDCVVLD